MESKRARLPEHSTTEMDSSKWREGKKCLLRGRYSGASRPLRKVSIPTVRKLVSCIDREVQNYISML